MHKEIIFTQKFVRSKERLSASSQQVVEEKIDFLQSNPAHPSLNVHRVLRAREKNMWICYIGISLRLLYSIEDDGIYLHDVGSHGIVGRLRA